jgi:DNA polymerase-4/protein ImuB
MKLQEALTKINNPYILPWDVDYYELCFENIINFLHQVSTTVEYVRPGLVYFDLATLYYTYRTDEEIIGFLEFEVSRFWKVNIGIGNSKLSSYIRAFIGPSAQMGKDCTVTDLQWGKLSIDLLPISLGNKVRLHQFALHTFGDILSLDIRSLQAQFGYEGKLIWDLVSDVCAEFLNPISTEESVHEKLSFQDPVVNLQVIITVVELLLDRALSRIKSFGLMPRIASISTEGFNGGSWRKKYSFKEPTADKDKIFSRIRSSLEGVSFSEPLESIKLGLEQFTGERGFQGSMLSQVRKHDQLDESIRQLKANFLEDVPIFKIKEVEPWSRIPEERYALVQYVP